MTDVASTIPDDLAAALDRARPLLGRFAQDVRFYHTVGSTNDVARDLAERGAADGVVVVANQQTAGRGRLGRSWFSPPGAGLYVSVVLDPPGAQTDPGVVTLGAGVALAEAIRVTTGVGVQLKWPNDLVMEAEDAPRRKLGGILAEGFLIDGRLRRVILGFGVNLAPCEIPDDLRARVTSLEVEAGRPVDRAVLLTEALGRLREVSAATTSEEAAALLVRWQDLSPSCRGVSVSWSTARGRCHGTTAGIDPRGALIVETLEGRQQIVSADVSWS